MRFGYFTAHQVADSILLSCVCDFTGRVAVSGVALSFISFLMWLTTSLDRW